MQLSPWPLLLCTALLVLSHGAGRARACGPAVTGGGGGDDTTADDGAADGDEGAEGEGDEPPPDPHEYHDELSVEVESGEIGGEPASSPPSVTPAETRPATDEPIDYLINDLLGHGVYTDPYDPAGYNAIAGGPVTSPTRLHCDLDTTGPCCWRNVEWPRDQLQWVTARGQPGHYEMHRLFGDFGGLTEDDLPPLPEGRYFVAAAKSGAASDEAHLSSCSVECAQGDITVSMQHWTSEHVLLQACLRRSFYDDPDEAPLHACQTFDRSQSAGPTAVALPGGELQDIVIVASHFVDFDGAAAVIDNIRVGYVPCELQPDPAPTTTEPLEPDAGAGCAEITCDFEGGDMCLYTSSQDEAVAKQLANENFMHVAKGPFKNMVTGVRRAREGSEGFMAAYLVEPDDTAAVEVELSEELQIDVVVSYWYYEATDGVQIEGCCDDPDDCQVASELSVENIEDAASVMKWVEGHFTCPQGTKKVLFVCHNEGKNQGACAVDDIYVRAVPPSGDPNDPSDPLC